MFPQTLIECDRFKELFSCSSCLIEPFYNGICDHLICRVCVSKSNRCPICSASFFQKEAQMDKTLREVISYIDEVKKLASRLNKSATVADQVPQKTDFLPDLDMTVNDTADDFSAACSTAARDDSMFMPPPALPSTSNMTLMHPPKITSTINSDNLMPPPPLPPPKAAAAPPKQRANKSRKSIAAISVEKTNEPTAAKMVEDTQKKSRKSKGAESNAMVRVKSEPMSQQIPLRSQTQSAGKKSVRKNKMGEAAIHLAVMENDLEKARQLIESGDVDVNVRDNGGWAPIHEAVIQNNIEMIELLLQNGADINAPGGKKNTPLHEAAINNKYESCKFLLENGANQCIRNELGIQPRDIITDQPRFVELFASVSHEQTSEIVCSQFAQAAPDESVVRGNSRRSVSVKKVVLFGTGMSGANKSRLLELASKLNLTFLKDFNSSVTHVVFFGDKVCGRTMNYMKAILLGIWVVNGKWLEDSLEHGLLLEENGYEATGSIKIPESNGPFKGRINASCQYPKLFEDCSFYLSGQFQVFPKAEMVELLQTGGAKILKREPKLDRLDELMSDETPFHLDHQSAPKNTKFCCSHFILYDVTPIKEIRHQYLYTVKPNWVFACIDRFKILHPES